MIVVFELDEKQAARLSTLAEILSCTADEAARAMTLAHLEGMIIKFAAAFQAGGTEL